MNGVRSKSPLVQGGRGQLKPKIVSLYEDILRNDDIELACGFWTEFFLLKPNRHGLSAILSQMSGDDLLGARERTQQLFEQAVAALRSSPEQVAENAVMTLSVLLREVLSKKYNNFSSDVITILTGLDRVDSVFSGFVDALDSRIRPPNDPSLRIACVGTTMRLVGGAYHSSLVSYFMNRDIFTSLMLFISDESTSAHSAQAVSLLGILANYNKFEIRNPYVVRISDCIDESAVNSVAAAISEFCKDCTDDYVAIKDDLADGAIYGMLSYVGLGALGGKTTPPRMSTPMGFEMLPSPLAAILLTHYEFCKSNRLFCTRMLQSSKSVEPRISNFLSSTSYLVNHQHRSYRTSLYARLSLLIILVILEDDNLCKLMCATKVNSRVCRQSSPYLPLVRGEREEITVVFDIIICAISHNMRKKLDVDFYILGVLLTQQNAASISLDGIMEVPTILHIQVLLDKLGRILALTVTHGDSFLPNSKVFDDFFYKLLEASSAMQSLRTAHHLGPKHPVNIAISVSNQYESLVQEAASKQRHMTPDEIQKVIKSGYESLSVDSDKGLDVREPFRESEERIFMKMLARQTVADASTAYD